MSVPPLQRTDQHGAGIINPSVNTNHVNQVQNGIANYHVTDQLKNEHEIKHEINAPQPQVGYYSATEMDRYLPLKGDKAKTHI